MGQVNVNSGTDRAESGSGVGMMVGLLLGLVLLLLVGWWAVTQSGWFGGMTPAPSTNVNITTNNPGGTTGGTGGTGGQTGGQTGGR